MKKIIAVVSVLLFLLGTAGCARNQNTGYEEIDPEYGTASRTSLTVSLYYANSAGTHLVAETRTIEIPVNARIDTTILEELIKGPSSSNPEMTALINKATKVVSITDSADVLIVTLSSDFLEWGDEATQYSKYLAVYSIVNTLVEASGAARVQLLVDEESSGTGQRVQKDQVGVSGEGVLDTLGRNGGIVLTPGITVNNLLETVRSRDYASAYAYVTHGSKTPDIASFQTAVSESKLTLESFSVGEVIVGGDGKTATVMVDYTIRSQDGNQTERTNIPFSIEKENGIWRMPYESFKEMFIES